MRYINFEENQKVQRQVSLKGVETKSQFIWFSTLMKLQKVDICFVFLDTISKFNKNSSDEFYYLSNIVSGLMSMILVLSD